MIKIKRFWTYELFVIIGIAMVIATLAKIYGYAEFSDVWFWFIAGLGLVIQGIIALIKQETFDKKYKVVLREVAKK